MSERRVELARTTLSVLFISGLIAGSLWILWPFLAAFVWAVMIVVATWPIMCRVQRFLWDSRALAVAVMCIALLAILLVPLGLAIDTILANTRDLSALASRLSEAQFPAPPSWLVKLPLVGGRAAEAWNNLSKIDGAELTAHIGPYVSGAVSWFARQAGSFALVLLQFLLVVVFSAVLYAGGESWGAWIRRFGTRLADDQGDRMVVLAGQAIRGVALGVVVTAIAQAVLGGIGFAIAGVPFAAVLTAIMFMLCIAQIGPILVLLAGTAWVYLNVGPVWGSLMLAWSLAVGLMDNFVRPMLIRRGADLPLLLIASGVVGGLVGFGIIGIFVGPVVIAVAYTLLDDWVAGEPGALTDTPRGEGSHEGSTAPSSDDRTAF